MFPDFSVHVESLFGETPLLTWSDRIWNMWTWINIQKGSNKKNAINQIWSMNLCAVPLGKKILQEYFVEIEALSKKF